MAITKETYGVLPTGEAVYQYTIDNGNGMRACILNYGGIITNLYVPDANGNSVDVVLGWTKLEDYLTYDAGYLGAAVGRNSNRIANGVFELNGKTYTLAKNDKGRCNLHGGNKSFSRRIWDVEEQENALVLHLVSPDGEEGFPGTAEVTVTYALTPENSLQIHYEAVADQDTLFNMTNHSYFNLYGPGSQDAGKMVLQMNSSFYTPNCAAGYPDGEIHSVTGTPFDFRAPKPLGQDWDSDFEQIAMFHGYDHNFFLDGRGFRKSAVLACPDNGIVMTMYTDLPCVQVYTGNFLDDECIGKHGDMYHPHESVCLETQYAPNAIQYSQFEAPIFRAGEKYDSYTEYRFSVCK